MSRLADAIRRSQRVESAPMGFGAVRPAPKPTLLVGSLLPSATRQDKDQAEADFIIIDGRGTRLGEADVQALRATGDRPLGAWIAGADAAQIGSLRQAGLDFVVVEPESTPATALLDEDLGYALALPQSPDETFLRSLDPFSLEALLLSAAPSPLTVGTQIELARIGVLGRKPLFCQVPAATSSEELQCLRAAGVVGLLTAAGDVSLLKATVAKLPPRRQRRDDRAVLSLPRTQAPTGGDEDDDDNLSS